MYSITGKPGCHARCGPILHLKEAINIRARENGTNAAADGQPVHGSGRAAVANAFP